MAAQPQWMAVPEKQDPNCPPGLEYLTQIDQLIVKQQIELLEAFTGFETQNKYLVLNNLGQQVYHAGEKSGCLERQCCGGARSFEMKILDNASKEVIRMSRPLRCSPTCCCECMRQHMVVESPPGTVVGHVKADCSCVFPSFTICGADESPVLQVKGPCCGIGCCTCEPKFSLQTLSGEEIGVIQKKISGLEGVAMELFTDADTFGITFPLDLDVKCKATLLGALFLIDYEFFEDGGHAQNDGGAAAAECGICCLLQALA